MGENTCQFNVCLAGEPVLASCFSTGPPLPKVHHYSNGLKGLGFMPFQVRDQTVGIAAIVFPG